MRSSNPGGFTILELLLAIAILMALIVVLLVILSGGEDKPQPRPAATIAEELVGAIGQVVSWKERFFGGAGPSIDAEPCAEAKQLVDRARALLDEYARNPGKDNAVLDKQTQELDQVEKRVRQWCQTAFAPP